MWLLSLFFLLFVHGDIFWFLQALFVQILILFYTFPIIFMYMNIVKEVEVIKYNFIRTEINFFYANVILRILGMWNVFSID
jgi:hypothetical protein